jgi:hypothetical protein
MRRVSLALSLCLLAIAADARPSLAVRHAHRVVRVAKPEPNFFERLFGVRPAKPEKPAVRYTHRVARSITPRETIGGGATSEVRPAECYGIPWCGCWLRVKLGIHDTGLNVARAWRNVGYAAEAAPGAIVVWAHHVGMLVSHVAGSVWVVKSGNDGHGNHVGEVPRSIKGAIAIRKL